MKYIILKCVNYLKELCSETIFKFIYFLEKIMIPAIYNLPEAYRGDNYGPISLKVKDSEGNYISLAGSRIDLHVKNKKNYAIVLSWSTVDSSIEMPDDYTIILKEKIGCKMGMPPGIYNYDLQIFNNERARSYLRGTLHVSGDITNIIFCDCEFNGGRVLQIGQSLCLQQ